MRVLVKLGGTLLDSAESRRSLSTQLAALRAETVVVHGGGKQLTRYLAERGVESRFVNGLRATTPETLDAVVKVLAGTVNHELVASLSAAGARAVGLSGIDAGIASAVQLDPELGSVGRVVRSDAALLRLLTWNGYLPVVACMAGDAEGRLYNVNADQMAAACAASFGADELIFLTDVDGVMDEEKRVRSGLDSKDCAKLIADGIATGGMQAKLNAVVHALREGARRVRIANGSTSGVLQRLLAGEELGTRVTA